ncbi:MAG: NAD-dependent epimerase/dehydratase family protein [Nocardioides sp.]
MRQRHVVVGAGPVGLATARELVAAGHDVVLASRSGTGPELAGVERVAADAADADRLTELAMSEGVGGGAHALYNCINPPSYDVWSTYWPPVAAAFLEAAERSGAVLVTASCLYGYGPLDVPMVEGMPDAAPGIKGRLRAQMWADALAAHEAGRIRAVEVRGSDYLGAGITSAHVPMVTPRALSGHSVWMIGRPDQPHSFTDVRDMGRALAAVATDERAWGRVWHAPTNPAVTSSQAVADVCAAVGRPPVTVHGVPRWALHAAGWFSPMMRELRETAYQFERPYVLDSSAITRELGLAPTPWADVCRATATNEVADPALR